jgi:hypothetical protein
MPRLLVALTAHGYGHVAQTAPAINALRRRLPALQLTIYTSVPRSVLRKLFDGEFELIPRAADTGMHMKDALEVDAAASARAYRHYHRHWEQTVAADAKLLSDLAPDAVLANVPYRILAASAQAGIPASAMCSLNWADIYRHFCGELPGAAAILEQMLAAYRSAHAFLQPAPSMPMTHLDNRIAIGPIARIGNDRRAEIAQRIASPDTAKLILVSLGGVPTHFNLSAWPALPDVYWIVPAAWAPQRRDAIAFESLAMDFVDVLRSADALITKPGYGSFVEAACNGVPVLYVPRRDWPEEACLVDWLRRHGRVLAIRREQLEQGDFAAALDELRSQPQRDAVIPAGIDAAADHLAALLKG